MSLISRSDVNTLLNDAKSSINSNVVWNKSNICKAPNEWDTTEGKESWFTEKISTDGSSDTTALKDVAVATTLCTSVHQFVDRFSNTRKLNYTHSHTYRRFASKGWLIESHTVQDYNAINVSSLAFNSSGKAVANTSYSKMNITKPTSTEIVKGKLIRYNDVTAYVESNRQEWIKLKENTIPASFLSGYEDYTNHSERSRR